MKCSPAFLEIGHAVDNFHRLGKDVLLKWEICLIWKMRLTMAIGMENGNDEPSSISS